jgi:thioredoxin-related protein
MKKITFLLFLLSVFAVSVSSQTIAKKRSSKKYVKVVTRERFNPNRDAQADAQLAILKASKENKRIILDVGGEWCGWCIHMDKFIEKNRSLKKLKEKHFVWVKINFSQQNENIELLSNYPTIAGYPHLFVLEKDGTLLKSQHTAELEIEKSYNLKKFMDFLNLWKSEKN